MTWRRLCALDDIEDGGTEGFEVGTADGPLRVMTVRRGDTLYAYVNSCPHQRSPLDFRPGQFLNLEKTRIMCTMHYALFRIEDGFCVHGPCRGKSLEPLAVDVVDGEVRIETRTAAPVE